MKQVHDVRPTSGKVLNALFSILESDAGVRGKNFLDLFAGTGRIGYEALNRGAKSVFFVEILRARAEEIKKNAPEKDGVLCLDIRRAFKWLLKRGLTFDIIFADPPYNEGWNESLTSLIEENLSLLNAGGIFVYEHAARERVEIESHSPLTIYDARDYGETCLTFFRRADE